MNSTCKQKDLYWSFLSCYCVRWYNSKKNIQGSFNFYAFQVSHWLWLDRRSCSSALGSRLGMIQPNGSMKSYTEWCNNIQGSLWVEHWIPSLLLRWRNESSNGCSPFLIQLDCPFILRHRSRCQITHYFMNDYKSPFVALSVREMISCSLVSLLKPPHNLSVMFQLVCIINSLPPLFCNCLW